MDEVLQAILVELIRQTDIMMRSEARQKAMAEGFVHLLNQAIKQNAIDKATGHAIINALLNESPPSG